MLILGAIFLSTPERRHAPQNWGHHAVESHGGNVLSMKPSQPLDVVGMSWYRFLLPMRPTCSQLLGMLLRNGIGA